MMNTQGKPRLSKFYDFQLVNIFSCCNSYSILSIMQ
ncbi:hypothetical protein BVRB_5g106430 isoform A [Beta vulgaris subsp. vulgaris]|nr:hypothetical protein BVRB_5g106430 isoform A [Beta vulgaris subsp. vulgaris]